MVAEEVGGSSVRENSLRVARARDSSAAAVLLGARSTQTYLLGLAPCRRRIASLWLGPEFPRTLLEVDVEAILSRKISPELEDLLG